MDLHTPAQKGRLSFEEYRAQDARNDGEDVRYDEHDDEEFEVVSAASFEGLPVPPFEWHVPGWMPHRNVTLLTGDGAAGKSILALQAAVATVLGRNWLGLETRKGPVLVLAAEDEMKVVHK